MFETYHCGGAQPIEVRALNVFGTCKQLEHDPTLGCDRMVPQLGIFMGFARPQRRDGAWGF